LNDLTIYRFNPRRSLLLVDTSVIVAWWIKGAVHPEVVGDGARRSRRFTVTQFKGIVIFPHLSLGHAEAD